MSAPKKSVAKLDSSAKASRKSAASAGYDAGVRCPFCNAPSKRTRPKYRKCENRHSFMHKTR